MAVAPSFQNFEFLCEPFSENGKFYIKAKNPSTGTIRKIRWYTNVEYSKNYGKTNPLPNKYGGLKHARGFDAGPILIIRNNTPEDEEWLGHSNARYAVGMGWYIISTEKVPCDRPSHFKFLSLSWEEARGKDDNQLKSPQEIANILTKKAERKEWIVDV